MPVTRECEEVETEDVEVPLEEVASIVYALTEKAIHAAEDEGYELGVNDGGVYLFAEVGDWSEVTFGATAERGPVGPLKHLAKEVLVELLGANSLTVDSALVSCGHHEADPTDIAELADVLILLCDATRRAGHGWLDLVGAAELKMAVNRTRTYAKPEGDAISEHDRSKD